MDRLIGLLILLAINYCFGAAAVFVTVGALFVFHLIYKAHFGHWMGE